ncbi:uncharacterized protein BDV17DRAFT_293075 [Aspergillus undulatus]|uniref:uncharacterized protein n=1 Tax=Aspergillus undulatus TaxID=1810928 RepID=UPI003CCDA8D6
MEVDFGGDMGNLPGFQLRSRDTVTLTHASLGEFFRSERNGPVPADGCPPVGIDSHDAKVMLLKRSYQIIFCPKDSTKNDIVETFLGLTGSTVIPTLKALDLRRCRKPDKQMIGHYLVQLVTDEWAMPRFAMSIEDVPRPEDVLDLFMDWLGDPEVQEALPPADRAWCASIVAGNPTDLFLPIVRYIASSWLGKDADDTAKAHEICLFLHDYL